MVGFLKISLFKEKKKMVLHIGQSPTLGYLNILNDKLLDDRMYHPQITRFKYGQ